MVKALKRVQYAPKRVVNGCLCVLNGVNCAPIEKVHTEMDQHHGKGGSGGGWGATLGAGSRGVMKAAGGIFNAYF